jgi:nitrous oxidase accessory protein NosD
MFMFGKMAQGHRGRTSSLALALACGLVGNLFGHAGPAMAATCDVRLQSLIDAAPAGSLLQVPACLYTESVVINKPLTLDGQGQAEIRGADAWWGWTPAGGGWSSSNTLPFFDNSAGVMCFDPRCQWPEQVFIDGRPLTQVAPGSTPGAGQFAMDGGRHVVIADNPNGHTIEVSTRTSWITTQSDNVTIRGFTMRYAANPAQTGAVGNAGHNNWTLANNNLYSTHGAIVVLGGPNSQLKVLNNQIAASGFEGILGFQNNDTLVQGNNVFWNNTEGFLLDWAGGGVKFSRASNTVMDGNEVHDNLGPGLWCDDACSNITFSSNRVYRNAGARPNGSGSPQIFFEISDGALISGNAVWGAYGNWPGIYLSNSADAEVRYNFVAWSDRGIQVSDYNRPGRLAQGIANVHFHDNIVLMSGPPYPSYGTYPMVWNGESGRPDPNSGDLGWANSFWFANGQDGRVWFQWAGQVFWNTTGFSSTPGGIDSRYLSDADKNYYSGVWSMPSSPQAAGLGATASSAASTAASTAATPANQASTIGSTSATVPSKTTASKTVVAPAATTLTRPSTTITPKPTATR